MMDAMGVSAAVLDDWPPTRQKLPSGITRFEYPFAEEAVRRFPARFAYVVRFDPNDPEIDQLVGLTIPRRCKWSLCLSAFTNQLFRLASTRRTLLIVAAR